MDLSEVKKFERGSLWQRVTRAFGKSDPVVPMPVIEWTVDEIGEILLQAADLIEAKGWCRRLARSVEGFCVFGAIYEISNGHYESPMRRLREVLPIQPIPWNDHICHSKEEAVAMLRLAARRR